MAKSRRVATVYQVTPVKETLPSTLCWLTYSLGEAYWEVYGEVGYGVGTGLLGVNTSVRAWPFNPIIGIEVYRPLRLDGSVVWSLSTCPRFLPKHFNGTKMSWTCQPAPPSACDSQTRVSFIVYS